MRRRVLRAALLLAAFVLVLLEVPLGLVTTRAARNQLVAGVQRDAVVLAGFVEEALEHGRSTAQIAELVRPYAQRTAGRVVVVDRDGISVVDTDPPEPGPRDFSTRPEVAAALAGQITSGTRFSRTLGRGLLYVAVPVSEEQGVDGAVRISYPTADLEARQRRIWLVLAGAGGVVLAAAALLALALSRSVTRPVTALTDAAERLGAGDLSARADESHGPPELRRLAVAFNSMAARLQTLVGAQAAFVGDASHQLRTPLTALRLRLENLEDVVEGPARAELDGVLAEADRLGRLVEGLLALARAESAAAEPERVDARQGIEEALARWRPVAERAGVRLAAGEVAPVRVRVVPGGLGQMLDNLVANAIRFSPPGGLVELIATADPPWLCLHVRDQGPGLSAEARARAFDRFWQGADRSGEGFGLGLAIVARLAEASGGRVALEQADGGGLDAQIRLPLGGLA